MPTRQCGVPEWRCRAARGMVKDVPGRGASWAPPPPQEPAPPKSHPSVNRTRKPAALRSALKRAVR
eukprot:14638971-Alexandrium_andersonii.AAC.1